MTVSELLEQLKHKPLDMLVMVSSDAEGNTIRKAYEADEAIWSDSYEGTCHPEDFPEHADYPEDAIKVVIIWPV